MSIHRGGVHRPAGAVVLMVAALTTACAGGGTRPVAGPSTERVEIGYGSTERRDAMGNVGTVEAADLRTSGMNVVEVLATRVPGVSVYRRPDGDLSVRIRGASRSMQGEPLVVVDGQAVHSQRLMSVFATLGSLQIKRIDVLKDAGSTAAYGMRGANGVILITTNRGS